MCSGTSVFIDLETHRDCSMVLAPSRKTPPLQFPMEQWESYVIIPEADADLCAWLCRDFCCPRNLWRRNLPERGEFGAYIMHVRAGRRALRRVKQSAGSGSSVCWQSSGCAFRPVLHSHDDYDLASGLFLVYNHVGKSLCRNVCLQLGLSHPECSYKSATIEQNSMCSSSCCCIHFFLCPKSCYGILSIGSFIVCFFFFLWELLPN